MSPLLIGVIVGVSLIALGGAVLLVMNMRREARTARARAFDRPLGDDVGETVPGITRTVFRLGEAVSKGKTSRSLREELARAGYHSDSAAAVYLGLKTLLMVVGVVGLCLLVLPTDFSLPYKIFLIGIGSGLLFFLPNIVLNMQRNKRRAEVQRVLPDAVDMLEICVSSGMGIDASWTAVADEIRRVSGVFADEMELTNLEVSLGVPRAEAMKHMADRTGADDLSSLVALLVQSERFGAGIVEALTTFAKTMRETRSQRAEEAAEKMAVKLLFPMVMFIFPALLIIMVGPALLELVKVIGGE
jgi:tight adherence protein C